MREKEFGARALGNRSILCHPSDSSIIDVINQMIKDRDQARVDKEFARADKLREQLYDMGVVIEDSPSGTKWRYE